MTSMNSTLKRLAISIVITLSHATHTVSAATVSTEVASPSAQGAIRHSLTSGYSEIATVMTTGYTGGHTTGISYTGIIEFKLPTLPAGFEVTSAILDLYVNGISFSLLKSNVMTWEMRGYQGNGVLDLSDAGASFRLSGPFTATMPSGGSFSLTESGKPFPMDVSSFLSGLYAQGATHVGFAVVPTAFPSDSGTFGFDIERTGDLRTPWGDPTLTITSAPIPEPSQLLLFLSATVLSIARRRHRRDSPNKACLLTGLTLDNLAPIAFQPVP